MKLDFGLFTLSLSGNPLVGNKNLTGFAYQQKNMTFLKSQRTVGTGKKDVLSFDICKSPIYDSPVSERPPHFVLVFAYEGLVGGQLSPSYFKQLTVNSYFLLKLPANNLILCSNSSVRR